MRCGQPPAKLAMVDGLPTSFPVSENRGPSWRINNDLKFSPNQVDESLKRLYELEKTRRVTVAKKLKQKYINDPEPQKLSKEKEEEQIQRIYTQASLTHKTRLAQAAKKHTTTDPVQKLSQTEMEESNERLYNLSRVKHREVNRKLMIKYYPENEFKGPKFKPTEEAESVKRLYYDRRGKHDVVMKRLTDKYVNKETPWIPEKPVKLTPMEVRDSVRRLTKVKHPPNSARF
eukprot:TRINITY_DN49488_c0_g1_i1.p1 TRINITY_DN49488_c0_g1~~TRINITY_DN49488_c0_g1_i1.p1  ORF type:complete len:247 (-),score=20.26 TRINITY_DN49488_c0_g1_i1:82-774(-)